ncbi:MAG: hypothetical protein KDA37_15345 [Planctomycetales bacterium]|nr:hypothetical protein [Planctomycetales bacterium]
MSQPDSPGKSFEFIRDALLRRGMPVEYANRSLAELADHHADLVEESRRGGATPAEAAEEASRRLGEPRKLVGRIVREYQCRTLTGRWPLLSFIVAPLPLLILGWVLAILTIHVAQWCIQPVWSSLGWGRPSTLTQVIAIESVLTVLLIAVPTAIAYRWALTAKRTTRNRFYVVAVCLIISAAAGSLWTEYTVSDVPQGGRLFLSSPLFIYWHNFIAEVPNPELRSWLFGPREALQLLAPLAAGGWLIGCDTKGRRRAVRQVLSPTDSRMAA